jgi:hypothetical protein
MTTPSYVSAFRRQFSQLRGKVYFNHGAVLCQNATVSEIAAE